MKTKKNKVNLKSFESPNNPLSRKNTVLIVLKSFLKKVIEQIESFKIIEEQMAENHSELLIRMIDKFTENRRRNIGYEEYELNSLVLLLKQIQGFQRFIQYNMIDEAALKLALVNINIFRYRTNSYIYRQGDKNLEFFVILKGRVSIKAKKASYEVTLKRMLKNKITKELGSLNLSHEEKDKILKDSARNLLLKSNSPSKRNSFEFEFNKSIENSPMMIDKGNKIAVSEFSLPLPEKKNENENKDDQSNSSSLFSSPRKSVKLKSSKRIIIDKFFSPTKRLILNEEEKRILDSEHQDELQRQTEGDCFGELEMLYNISRTSSAIAVEDTIVFSIEKQDFDRHFSKCLYKAELEKKKFMLQKIPAFGSIPIGKFHDFYRKITPVFFKSKEVVYSENTPADSIYLLFYGSCKLQKNFIKNRSPDVSLLDMKLVTLVNLERGEISGLESVAGPAYYEFTLVASSEYVVLFRMSTSILNQELSKLVLLQLVNLHKRKNEILKEILKKRTLVKQKMKLRYRDLSKTLERKIVEEDIIKREDVEGKKYNINRNRVKSFMKLGPIDRPVALFSPGEKHKNLIHPLETKIKNITQSCVNIALPNQKIRNVNRSVDFEMKSNMQIEYKINYNAPIQIQMKSDYEKEYIPKLSENIESSATAIGITPCIYSELVYLSPNNSNNANFSSFSNFTNNFSKTGFSEYECFSDNPDDKHPISIKHNYNKKLFVEDKNSTVGFLLKKKIFKDEFKGKHSEDKVEKCGEINKPMNNLVKDMKLHPEKNNKNLIKNVVTWKKTVANKKTPFNTGSFNLPLFVFKKKIIK